MAIRISGKEIISNTQDLDIDGDGTIGGQLKLTCPACDVDEQATSGTLIIGSPGAHTLAFDKNHIQSRYINTASSLDFNPHGGDVRFGGGILVEGNTTFNGTIMARGDMVLDANLIHIGSYIQTPCIDTGNGCKELHSDYYGSLSCHQVTLADPSWWSASTIENSSFIPWGPTIYNPSDPSWAPTPNPHWILMPDSGRLVRLVIRNISSDGETINQVATINAEINEEGGFPNFNTGTWIDIGDHYDVHMNVANGSHTIDFGSNATFNTGDFLRVRMHFPVSNVEIDQMSIQLCVRYDNL